MARGISVKEVVGVGGLDNQVLAIPGGIKIPVIVIVIAETGIAIETEIGEGEEGGQDQTAVVDGVVGQGRVQERMIAPTSAGDDDDDNDHRDLMTLYDHDARRDKHHASGDYRVCRYDTTRPH